jgi:phosphonoacetaldehyde hydrolase
MGKAKADHVRALLAIAGGRRRLDRGQRRGARRGGRGGADGRPRPADAGAAAEAAELIPGAAQTVAALRAAGLKVASSTGYTREMMAPVLIRAAEQGYAPDHLVCAGETPQGRPSPLMIYKACAELGVWPLSRVVKVDDAEAGIGEGRAAGCFTVGVSASGNATGLSRDRPRGAIVRRSQRAPGARRRQSNRSGCGPGDRDRRRPRAGAW